MSNPEYRHADLTQAEIGWAGTMSLPRVLTLAKDGSLLMNPPEELELLRYNPTELNDLSVKADSASTSTSR
jgi:beta-fructofuranosidase